MKDGNINGGKAKPQSNESKYEIRDSVILLLRKIASHKAEEKEFVQTIEALLPLVKKRMGGISPRPKFRMHLFMQWHTKPHGNRVAQPTLMIDCDRRKVWFLYGFVIEPTLSGNDHHIVVDWTIENGKEKFFGDRSHEYLETEAYTPLTEAIKSIEFDRDCNWISLKCGVTGFASYQYEQRFEKPVIAETPQTIEEAIFSHVDEEKGRRMQIYRIPAPTHCGMCECEFAEKTWLVDGTLRNSLYGMDLCVECAYDFGRGIGWGHGQIYKKQSDGRWLCVGGFRPEEEDYENNDAV